MVDKERGGRGDTRGRETRAASPIIGIILLFALVMMGAMLVFVAGSAMFDAIQSETNREQVQQYMLETDHRLSTVAETKKEQVLPDDGPGGSNAKVTADGSIQVAWYTNGSDPWNDPSCTASDNLGALEFEKDDGTIAHQGGGIWERTDGGTAIISEPNIGYDGETLQLQVLQLDKGDIGGSETIARANHSRATAFTNEINRVATECGGGANVAIRIESSYHDGWYRFLEDSLGEDEYDEVTITQTSDTVEVRIEGIREPDDRPPFIIADDLGVMGPSNGNGNGNGANTLEYDNRLPYAGNGANPPFRVGAKVENTRYTKHTETVTVTIWDENRNTKLLSESEEVEIAGNGSKTLDGNEFHFTHSQYGNVLEAGETYKYVIETESGDRTDNPPGSFYFGKPEDFFDVTNGSATVTDNTVTIITDLQNVGIENGSQTATLKLDYQDDLPDDLSDPYGMIGGEEVNRSFGASDPVEFTLNGSKLIDGQYEATIQTDNTTETVVFNVSAGIDPGRVGLSGVEDANVTVEVMGSQVSGGGATSDHQLAPMTLDIVANGGTEHSFTNPNGGNNVNTGPTWQDKSDTSYRYEFTVDEETDLTLRNTRYSATKTEYVEYDTPRGPIEVPTQVSTCADKQTNPATLPHYSGPLYSDLGWCNDVPTETAFGPIDASQGQNLQNVRVRSAENNTIPALPAGAAQQMSATEVLQERGLIKGSGDELDLESGEFVFLFDNTANCGRECDENDIDALWNQAIDAYNNNPHQTHDPDFNDLIVYVEVERAGVDPGKPGITIQPGGGDSTGVGAGNSDSSETGTRTNDTGVTVDTDSIVIG